MPSMGLSGRECIVLSQNPAGPELLQPETFREVIQKALVFCPPREHSAKVEMPGRKFSDDADGRLDTSEDVILMMRVPERPSRLNAIWIPRGLQKG
jgi:hypothetical protein